MSIGDYLPNRGENIAFSNIGTVLDCEEELRVVAATALQASHVPSIVDIIGQGPGTLRGQRRFIPIETISHYWMQYRVLAPHMGWADASYRTFSRCHELLFEKQKIWGFRKSEGQHAVCSACTGFKQEPRRAITIQQRHSIFEVSMSLLV